MLSTLLCNIFLSKGLNFSKTSMHNWKHCISIGRHIWWTRIIVIGVWRIFFPYLAFLPFLALVFFNYKIYKVLQRRNAMNLRLKNERAQYLKKKAAQQAKLLFVIVMVFGLCQTMRVALGIHEFIVLDEYHEAMKSDCNAVKLPILVLGEFKDPHLHIERWKNISREKLGLNIVPIWFLLLICKIHLWRRKRKY